MVYLVISLQIQSILLTVEIPKFAVVPVMAASSDLLVEQFRHFLAVIARRRLSRWKPSRGSLLSLKPCAR